MAQLGREGLADLPLFLFGHSMGSLAVRVYLARHAFGLSGALLFGTAFIPVRTAATARMLAQLVARVRGATSRSKMLDRAFMGTFNQDIDHPETPVDWLSFNRENVDRYLADKRCGFSFTAGAYYALATLLQESCSSSCAASYPHDLPLLFVSGTEDPVGEYGQDVSRAADLVHGAGVQDVRCRLYAGMRHEVLNEKGRKVVFEDVASWIEGHLA
jgi:alpha-beta hydrolase superfamily lysophospholipase